MVIDFHVHCFPDDLAPKAVKLLGERADMLPRLDGTVQDVRNSMKKANVDCSVLLNIATKPTQTEKLNTWAAEVNNNGIIAFGSVHPEYEEYEKELKRIKSMGLKGIKLHPDYQLFYVDEERVFPIYELAAKLGLIVVFHAGVDVGLPPPYHCDPQRLLKVIEAFPEGRFVAAHMGSYSYWDDVEKYLVGRNIYFDTSYCISCIDRRQIRRIIENHDREKVLFATDSPWRDQQEEIFKLRRLNLGMDVEEAILGSNALKLLK